MTSTSRGAWGSVLLVLVGGITAAIQLGKVAQVLPALRADLDLSPVASGWAVSLIALLGALLGVSAGSLIRGMGLKRALVVGLGVLAAGGALAPFATGAAPFLAARFLEGVGYLLVVVAAPALIAAIAEGRARSVALSLWSSFVVLGFAAAGVIHSAFVPMASWRVEFGALAALVAALTLLAWRLVPTPPVEPARSLHLFLRDHAEALREGPALRLALAFGLYVVLSIGFYSFLPTHLLEAHGAGEVAVGRISAVVGLAAVPGTMIGAALLRRGQSGVVVGGTWLAAMVVFGIAVYLVPGLALAAAASIAYSVANGVVGAACFATMPRLFADPSRVPLGFGLIALLGSLGTLIAPPILAGTVEAGGWEAVPYLYVALGIGGLLLLASLRRQAAAVASHG